MALITNSASVGAQLAESHHPHHLTTVHVSSAKNGGSRIPKSSSAILAQKIIESEKRLLAPGQKIIIVPAGKGEPKNHVKIQVGSTSSDSSDGKRTPPRRQPSKLRKSTPMARSYSGLRPPSLKSLHGQHNGSWASISIPDGGNNAPTLRPLSDVVSVRSLASIGMGSTDGKKLTIRRVPTSPSELLNIANPTT